MNHHLDCRHQDYRFLEAEKVEEEEAIHQYVSHIATPFLPNLGRITIRGLQDK
ncbi:hypothetical protein [Acidovorax sp. Root219]|uniref:hypothetical protein n=1 Tax=Acidovorax sp. Root219 TaxID=1736493 RepID=UPI001F1E8208|nr:hypothetical protein [Acidovorax sp. Root219]